MPRISVIVPVYKVEQFLPTCVQSILGQTFADFELILVDDGSPDGCGALCDAYAEQDSRVRVIHQKNGGLSAARNSGIAAAKGELLAFVDSDDLIAPDYLEQLYNALCSSGADMALCAVEDVNEDGSPLEHPEITAPAAAGSFSGKALLAEFFGPNATCYTVAWNKLYKRSLWEQLRYPEGLIHEDDAVAHRLFAACETVSCLDAPLYRYRLRQGSICRSGISPGSFDGVTAHADWCRFFRDQGMDKALLDKALAACFRRYLALCAGAKNELTWPIAARWHGVQAELRCLLPLVKHCGALSLTEKLSCLRWCTRPLPLPGHSGTPRAALLLPPELPVPAVKGGAVETLATHLMEENQTQRQLELALVCRLDEEAAAASARFSQSLIFFVPPAGRARSLVHRVRYRLAKLAKRPVYWQEYQHYPLPFLKRLNADLYSVEGGQLDAWQQAAACFGAEKMAAHLHGVAYSSPALDAQFGRVLAISDYVRRAWLSSSALPADRALLLLNCVDTSRFCLIPSSENERAQLRSRLGLTQDDFVVLFCGRVCEEKGIHRLVQAMRQIQDPAVKLAVIGSPFFAGQADSPFFAELRKQAAALGERIVFTGFVPNEELPAYYRMADAACFPALWEEPAGITAIEAMACGCPVIATDSGGMPEYLEGSGAVLLRRDEIWDGECTPVPGVPELSGQIAEAILALKDQPARRAEMAAAGVRRAQDFSRQSYYQTFAGFVRRMRR